MTVGRKGSSPGMYVLSSPDDAWPVYRHNTLTRLINSFDTLICPLWSESTRYSTQGVCVWVGGTLAALCVYA